MNTRFKIQNYFTKSKFTQSSNVSYVLRTYLSFASVEERSQKHD